jgi:hypothetical protein
MGFIAPKNIYGNSLLGFVPPINKLAFGQPSTATLLSSLLVQRPATHRWFFVRRRFNQFLENLKITADQAEDGETKHKGVVASLNQAYWGYRDETANRILIGSWGKTTRVRPPRDVDILFILPNELYWQFEKRRGNRQSQLLQDIRSVLRVSNPATDIRVSVLIAGELRRLVSGTIEPFAHGGHLARKIRHAQPDRGGVHVLLSLKRARAIPK